MKDKPEVTESMMISIVEEKKEKEMVNLMPFEYEYPIYQEIKTTKEKVKTFIMPLQNFRIIETEKKQSLTLFKQPNKIASKFPQRKKVKKLALSLTDDPKIEWAGDWSDLGCFRLVLKFFDASIRKKTNRDGTKDIIIEVEKGKYNKDMTIPDKVVQVK